ncbi:MAG: hypothetical protein KAS32_07775 [Candidatus Peribacteraceae bacterium]|nr:hypothetical protein [Candidatus Peribacteraceae bacterium]
MSETEELKKRIRELEAGTEESIVRGHKKVIEIIAGGKKYFCDSMEGKMIFSQNNPGVKVEMYNIELPLHLADRYLNDPENKKQFTRPVEEKVEIPEEPASPPIVVEEPAEQTWRQQAKELGIPLHKEPPGSGMRKKEDVLVDIINRITVPTLTS